MIDSGFKFTQISTTNLDLHTKGLERARNPPKRLGFGSCFSGDSFRNVRTLGEGLGTRGRDRSSFRSGLRHG
ncbi:hypothetical protein LINGRAHAP2_LOCUS3980, partial [Linum grandiflorum]